jgi:hypothetical protein
VVFGSSVGGDSASRDQDPSLLLGMTDKQATFTYEINPAPRTFHNGNSAPTSRSNPRLFSISGSGASRAM